MIYKLLGFTAGLRLPAQKAGIGQRSTDVLFYGKIRSYAFSISAFSSTRCANGIKSFIPPPSFAFALISLTSSHDIQYHPEHFSGSRFCLSLAKTQRNNLTEDGKGWTHNRLSRFILHLTPHKQRHVVLSQLLKNIIRHAHNFARLDLQLRLLQRLALRAAKDGLFEFEVAAGELPCTCAAPSASRDRRQNESTSKRN